jgi:hypothetical protein
MPWIVSVPFTNDGKTELRTIETDVEDGSNAISQAKHRNEGPGFDWDQAQVEKE